MSEALSDQPRLIYLSKQQEQYHIVMFPPLTDEERTDFPVPRHMGTIHRDKILCNNSQLFTIPDFPPGKAKEEQLVEYAREVSDYLGNCLLNETIYNIHPDTFFEPEKVEPSGVMPLPQYL